MSKSIFFIAIGLLTLSCTAQTAPEKVAAAFCECSKTPEYAAAVKLLKSGDSVLIRQRFEEISTQFFLSKRCAKNKVVLTKEENRKVPEEEIEAALNKNCPDVAFLGNEYRRISWIIDQEQKQLDLATRHKKIEQHIAKKEIDSVQYELSDYRSMYGFESENGPKIVSYYYQIGDFANGNAVALELIEAAKNDYIIYDDRADKSISINDFVRNGLLEQAKKYKQQEVLDALK